MKQTVLSLSALTLLAILDLHISTAQAQGTAFAYQGRLNDGGSPANGTYDLQFAVFDAANAGSQQGNLLTNSATAVSNGLFTVTLDFGNQFPGAARWLEIGVRTNGTATFFMLSPRQALTPAPYAITAGSVISGGLAAGSYGNAVTLNNAANQFTGAFTGNGVNVTNVNAATLGGLASSNLWQLGGNTVSVGQFLGTANNQPVTIRANNLQAMQFAYASNAVDGFSPNVIGGYSGNAAAAGVVGATIGGGGSVADINPNLVNADFGTVVGGSSSVAGGKYAVAGGYFATAGGQYSVAMGKQPVATGYAATALGAGYASGSNSTAMGLSSAVGDFSTAMGYLSSAYGNTSTAMGHSTASTIFSTAMGSSTANGIGSTAMGFYSTAGGYAATAMGYYSQAIGNSSTALGVYSIARGFGATALGNSTNTGDYSTAMGQSTATGTNSTAMGQSIATNNYATAMGTAEADGQYSTAMGLSTASGDFSTAMGEGFAVGHLSTATGISEADGYASFAAGYQAIAAYDRTFVWSDGVGSAAFDFVSSGPDQFLIHADGGVGIGTSTPETALHIANASGITLGLSATSGGYTALNINLSAVQNGYAEIQAIRQSGSFYGNLILQDHGGNVGIGKNNPTTALDVNGTASATSFNTTSDRNLKENFSPASPREVLDKVAALPISEWDFKQEPATRHIGPMAQDFYAAFKVGTDDKHIATVDEDGVALAAIQGLNQKLDQKDAEIQQLKQSVAQLQAMMTQLSKAMPK